jgi:hypothetical protein
MILQNVLSAAWQTAAETISFGYLAAGYIGLACVAVNEPAGSFLSTSLSF